ncbi:hypothetical protein AV656_08135 [Bhargavaea cecembensis]|uniref:Uncharacterized protein n=1 Tax=Bhargavaea cecembensis TaxID=394098 RepID=A0A161ST93_9BACL|nr:hypothetical protein AV656_08135 [Bhargavaea cecembensis]
MWVFIVNIFLVGVLSLVYYFIDNKSSKSFISNIEWKHFYLIFLSPSILFIFNLVLLFLIQSELYWLSGIYLMIPVIETAFRWIKEKKRYKEYKKIEKTMFPWLITELNNQRFYVSKEDINLTYYKEFNKKRLDIRIKSEDHNKKCLSYFEDYVQQQIRKNVNLLLIVRILTEKKN